MKIPPYFQRASEGFYQGALEYGGHTVEDCVGFGVGMVLQSQCPALLEWLDFLIASPPEVVYDAWWSLRCEYKWVEPEYIREILCQMREICAHRVATGGGGMPG
ncbi:hypothetical protein EYW49_09820 [Siculibacillus lacustris]|uniref:Uncharacterized protein n=1 Tax=Siculibacillus lacustris TaxID=1549641 RepID=A0A4Q9VQW7_9HYPH|nr:hypothetical protein [Siculibacillus lacustris]TBW38235.1 hypothetical protein EYW49_09820 [Siculibacillus lacustris]